MEKLLNAFFKGEMSIQFLHKGVSFKINLYLSSFILTFFLLKNITSFGLQRQYNTIILKRLKKDENQAIFCCSVVFPVEWLQLCSNEGILASENILEPAAKLWWEVISHIPCCLLQGTMTIKGQEKLLKPLYESKPKIIGISTLLTFR